MKRTCLAYLFISSTLTLVWGLCLGAVCVLFSEPFPWYSLVLIGTISVALCTIILAVCDWEQIHNEHRC